MIPAAHVWNLSVSQHLGVPALAQLQVEQRQRVQQALDRHQAVNLLLLPAERRQLRSLQSPQLAQRVEAVAQRLAAHVLACHSWAAAGGDGGGEAVAVARSTRIPCVSRMSSTSSSHWN